MSEQLPSKKSAIELLRRSGCSENVIQHCKTVAKLAVGVAKVLQNKGLNVDVELVEIGALLHDIGRSKTHSVNHAIAGSQIAQAFGLPEPLVKIIERHVGGGIPPDEAERLGWPRRSYVPETLEEKIVSYADKLIEGTNRISIEQTIAKFSQKLGKNHPSLTRLKALHEEIDSLLDES